MVDDADMIDAEGTAPVHYGQINPGSKAEMLEAGIAAGNISRPSNVEVLDLPEVHIYIAYYSSSSLVCSAHQFRNIQINCLKSNIPVY